MRTCHYCKGVGRINSISSQSVQVLRAIEEDIIQNGRNNINLSVGVDLSNYLLNSKRKDVFQIEDKYNISITIIVSNTINEDIYMIDHEKLDEPLEKNESSVISIDTVYENDSDEKDGAKKIKNKKNSVSGSRSRKKSSKPSTSTSKIQKSELEKDEIKVEEKKPSLKNAATRKKPESKKKEIKKSPQVSADKKKSVKSSIQMDTDAKKKIVPVKKKVLVEKKLSKELPKEDQKTGWWDD
jgi:ribonuclease E